MAFHHRLALWQKILLGIFCFPLLPFYLCYLCCAGDDGKEAETEENGGQDVGAMERGTTEQMTGTCWTENGRGSLRKGRMHQKDSLELHRHKVSAKIHCEPETTPDPSQNTEGGHVSFEFPPKKNTTPSFLKTLSFGKGKRSSVVRDQDNKGFEGDENKKVQQQKVQKGIYAYPWDKSSLKSLDIDLKKFEKLDAYASTIDVRGTVENLVQILLQEAHTELEKVRAIWMWVCHHIEYDTVGYHNTNARSCDPKDVLQSRKSVCAGYARLFMEMCRVAGVQCVEVSGHSKGYSYRVGQKISGKSDHSWNAVNLEGRWHLLDSTWGAGHVNDNCTQFKFEHNELRFLTHPAIFVEDHLPEDKDWQLLSSPLSVTQFENIMRHNKGFYNLGLLTADPDTPLIKTVNGKVVISVEGRYPTLFMFDVNGSEQAGIMTLKKCGMSLDVYPKAKGSHKVLIFAKAFNSSEDSYSSALEYLLECDSVDKTIIIPKELQNPVGPSWLTEKKGFLHPSHPDPIIYMPDGRCSVSFTIEDNLDILATLHTDDMTMTDDVKRRHIFTCKQGNRLVLKIQLPQKGNFVLQIFSKSANDRINSYNYAFNYLISCNNAAVKWPVFPLAYTTWMETYELVEPTAGVLPANRNVHFKLKVPGATSVFVKDKREGPLTLTDDGYWEGSFNTAGCQDVQVMIQETPTSCYYGMLKYDVETH